MALICKHLMFTLTKSLHSGSVMAVLLKIHHNGVQMQNYKYSITVQMHMDQTVYCQCI